MDVRNEGSNSVNRIGHYNFYVDFSQPYDILTVRRYVIYVNEGVS
jgi:hypothetical protein